MIKRDKYLKQLIDAKENGFPKVITGIRRCGKSYLLKEIYRQYLLSENIVETNIHVIELDDDRNIEYRDPIKLGSHVREICSSSAMNTDMKDMNITLCIRSFEKCTCLYIDENVELEKLGISVGKLYEKAARAGVEPVGSHFVQYDRLDDEAKFSMRTCLPVADRTGEDTVEISEDRCLHLNFKGGFSKVSDAHQVINKYAQENNIRLSARAYEVYNKDMSVDVYYCLE